MIIAHYRTRHMGAIYVEAAIIMPVILLVVFASMFLFLMAARHFSLQMLASEIAKDISLSLGERDDGNFQKLGGCIQNNCPKDNPPAEPKINLPTLLAERYGTAGCWNLCAQRQYLLATTPSGSSGAAAPGLRILLTAIPTFQWFDPPPAAGTNVTSAAAGDYVQVELRYPIRAILGRGIALFGAVPNVDLVGTAVTSLERPQGPEGG